jgi:hypothetical protein
MTYNGKTFDVLVEAGIHSDTGEVFATFQSIDPNTELPPDVLTGFLPPEDGTGRGQGHISYTIQPKASLPTGTQIRNVALITFDQNAAIATDQADDHDPSKGVDPAKQALVSIDADAPTSSVLALPATTQAPGFLVRWAGDDANGSGVAAYDVYVSVDGGPFSRWLAGTAATSVAYAGAAGQAYAFYSVAVDHVGNREAAPTSPDSVTFVAQVTNPGAPPPISAALFTKRVGKKKRLAIRVTRPDGLVREIISPFQKPVYSSIRIATLDSDGDGSADTVVIRARKGKKKLTRTVAV